MERESALLKLEEEFLKEKERTGQEFASVLKYSKDRLKDLLYEGIRGLNKEYPVQVLQFLIMRTDLYQGRCRITICGYDKSWYQDVSPAQSAVDTDFLYEPFSGLLGRLTKNMGVYLGAVTDYDARNLVCEYFMECFAQMADHVRSWFFLFDEWAVREGFHFPVPYRIIWGPYREKTEVIFAMDRTGKTDADLTAECREEEKKKRAVYFYRCFVQSSLQGYTCREKKFAFLNMKQSKLKQTVFENCQFASPAFQDSEMEFSSFAGSSLFGSNFSRVKGYQLNFTKADIRNSTLEGICLRKGDFTEATLNGAAFTEGTLEECSFRGAFLTDVDLRVQTLEGIDFTGAVLERVYIWEKDAKKLSFTDEQAQHVLVMAEHT